MKKKTWKRAASLFMTAAMTAGLFTGCGNGGNDAGGSDQADSGVPTFEIVTVRYTDAWPSDFLESGVMAELEEKYGVNIEWKVYYMSDWAEQKSLLLASGDLPDAFFGSTCLTPSDLTQNKNSFIDLTPYVNEETMPNFTKVLAEDPELLAACTERDGAILSLPKRLPLRPEVCGYVQMINQDWLDNLGLKTPETYQELEDVLYKFVTEDADGDGDPTNEIGVTNYASTTILSLDLRNILSSFGTMVSRQNNYMGLNASGDPVFMPVEENYKEAVKWMHGLWEKGILDPEYFTQDNSMYLAKLQADGGAKVGYAAGWTPDGTVGVNADQFSVLKAVEGIDGKHYVENASSNIDVQNREFVVTTACENPEKLMEWADAFYDDLVALQTYYGSISEGYITDNGDGTYTVNEPADGSSLDTSAWMNSFRDYGPKYVSKEFQEKVILPTDQGDGLKLTYDDINIEYLTTDTNQGMPVLHYTEEEQSRLTTIGTDIYSYVESMYAHWVVDGGIDEEWDSYLAKLDQMGLQELIEIQETAFAAYEKAMAK